MEGLGWDEGWLYAQEKLYLTTSCGSWTHVMLALIVQAHIDLQQDCFFKPWVWKCMIYNICNTVILLLYSHINKTKKIDLDTVEEKQYFECKKYYAFGYLT